MKLNQLALLGVTSLMIAVAPVTHTLMTQSPAQAAPVASAMAAPAMTSPATAAPAMATQTTVAQTTAQSVALETGTFVAGEAPTTGTARIVNEDGHRYLELDAAFSTSNMGPDLHVLLDSTNRPPQSYSNLGSAINLGKLHSASGAQRYPIPDVIDLASFKSVVVWCRMANATFGYAPLSPVNNATTR